MGSAASDPGAGGINNRFAATLVLRNSVVSGNHAVANSTIANSASSGGIGSMGALDIEDSVVSDNTVEYTGSMDFDDQSGVRRRHHASTSVMTAGSRIRR